MLSVCLSSLGPTSSQERGRQTHSFTVAKTASGIDRRRAVEWTSTTGHRPPAFDCFNPRQQFDCRASSRPCRHQRPAHCSALHRIRIITPWSDKKSGRLSDRTSAVISSANATTYEKFCALQQLLLMLRRRRRRRRQQQQHRRARRL